MIADINTRACNPIEVLSGWLKCTGGCCVIVQLPCQKTQPLLSQVEGG